ncbi:MAG: BspA family leucine-rich repeat surface protein, partial [Erysipelotrichaceae bacterium]|nr:BspA family leucine-rich repeat surface protein [Erysipelotrichaceae bacterium]
MKRRQNNLFYWFRYLVLFVLMFAGFVLLSPGSIHAQENAEEPVPMTEPSEPTQIETTPVPEVSEQSEPTDDTIPAEPIQSQKEVVPETPAATPTNNPVAAVPAAKATTVSQPALHTNAADTSWQSDWTYTVSGNNIILQDYKGSDSEYKVPAVATINGVDYSTIFGRGGSSYAFKNTAIKKLKFEEGVRLNTNASYLFYNNKTLESVDFTGVDASQTTNMQSLFYNATAVKNVIMDDLNTEKVTNMRYLFYNATGIETLSAKNVDFTSVTTLGALFNNSSSTGFSYLKDLRTIDLTGADFSRVTSL